MAKRNKKFVKTSRPPKGQIEAPQLEEVEVDFTVIGGDVKVTPTAVTHGKLTVSIQEDTAVVSEAQGAMQNANSTVAGTAATTAQDTQIGVEEENARAFVFDTGTSLSEIVDAINNVGASAADLVAILEALREAGSLRAELIII